MAVATEGLSRLRVGGARLSRIASAEKIASTAPAAPRRWPIADLVEDIETFPAALPNSRSTAASSVSSPLGVEGPWGLVYSVCGGGAGWCGRRRLTAHNR